MQCSNSNEFPSYAQHVDIVICAFFVCFFPSYSFLSLHLLLFIYFFFPSYHFQMTKFFARSPCYPTADNHSKPSVSQIHNGLFCSVPRICLLYTYLLSTSIKYFYSWNYTLPCYIIQSFKHNYNWQVCEALKRKIHCKRPEWIDTSIAGPVDLSFVSVISDPVRGF